MTRKKWYNGALYHVTVRGNNRNNIFRDKEDFEYYFNEKYNYIGHLFKDRYFSELIKSDEQMLETSRYVHLNPVRANMIEKVGEYGLVII